MYNPDDEDQMSMQGAPTQTMMPPVAPPPPAFNPASGLPPAPVQQPISPPANSMPPPSPQNELQDYLAQQKAGMQKYGPEQQMAVEQAIAKNRQGLIPNLANAGAGFADAIMQGVARAGPGNFQANLQNRVNQNETGYREAMKNAQTGKMAQMKQEMELAQMDPESPLSKLAQRSASPLLTSLGLSPEEIKQMPASLIGEAQTKHLSLEEIRAKAAEAKALHELQAGTAGASLAQIHAHQTAEENAAAAALKQHGDEFKAAHPIASGIQSLLGAGEPSTGPLGAETVKNGKTYEWSPSTGKYHLKQ